jgi:hypothetical protein
MRLIFSRKGFDSSTGKCPSPLVDGRPRSLPIPTKMPSRTRYGDLAGDFATMVEQLTRGRLTRGSLCHLDPDLEAGALPRRPGWRGAFGQVAAAQGHLRNSGVTAGDLFLFFGLFRPAVLNDRWRFMGPREHRIFGWLQIGRVLEVGADPSSTLAEYPWLAGHPHLERGWPASNTVYLASEALVLGGEQLNLPGWGLFAQGHRLTAPDSTQPSFWRIPDWLNPRCGGCGLTYHPPVRWDRAGTVRAAAKGQEFVADVGEQRAALEWVRELMRDRA